MLAGAEAWVVALAANSCPRRPEDGTAGLAQGAWSAGPGGAQVAEVRPLVTGRYCISAWARDGVGRLGRAATTFVDYVAPARRLDD